MKTTYRTEYGPSEVVRIEEVDVPEPGAGQVLVRVHAATVNRTDCGALWGRPFIYRFFVGFPRPRHVATGSDFAGEIAAVGNGVSAFAVGDRVWGFDDNGAGSHAEYLVFPASGPIARMPASISFEEAAASLEGAHYAINFIDKVKLEPGQHVLVNGATGAIGSAAVQLLKARGIHVTAVCAGEHSERVRGLGAARVIDFTSEDFTKEDVQYSFVFDAVGKSTFQQCRRVLAPRGIYISSELGPGGQNIWLALLGPLSPGKKVIFPVPFDIRRTLSLMGPLVDAGQFRPLIDRRYPIERIREAFDYVQSGQKIGNVVLTLG